MKKYVLYGAGWYAEKFLYRFKEKDSVEYCIDRHKKGFFHGYPIHTPEDALDMKRYMILVTTEWENYKSIRDILKKKGLTEFVDFLWAEAFGKKIAVINANCYDGFYRRCLCMSRSFTEEYIVWNVPQIQLNKEGCIQEELLEACDLYIHQDIRTDNAFGYKLSDEYILSRLKAGCRTVTVPNMVGMGKWNFPSAMQREFRGEKPPMFWRDSILDAACEQYGSLAEIKRYVMSEELFSENTVRELFSDFLSKLEKRERNWDITISDYILQNYRTEKMFYDIDHPADGVMQEIGRRLRRKLDITDVDGRVEYLLNWDEAFTFPSVKKALELIYEEKYIRKEKYQLCEMEMDIDEYIREYAWWFYDVFL